MSYIRFIKDNWVPLALTWWDYRQDPIDTLYLADPEYAEQFIPNVENDTIPETIMWSCFFMQSFMMEMFGVLQSLDPKEISDIDDFVLEKGYIYAFDIMDHAFTIVWDLDDNLYYVDYWIESKEGIPFRLDLVTEQEVLTMLNAYINEDFETFARFHKAYPGFGKNYGANFRETKHRLGSNWEWLKLTCNKQPITFHPTIQDVQKAITRRPPQLEDPLCKQVYDYFLNKVL